MKHELKKVGILSAGKIIGLLYAAITIILLPFSLIFLGVGIFTAVKGNPEGYGMIAMGVFFLFSPVIYGAGGFIFGALAALLYNWAAKKFGGLVFETVSKE